MIHTNCNICGKMFPIDDPLLFKVTIDRLDDNHYTGPDPERVILCHECIQPVRIAMYTDCMVMPKYNNVSNTTRTNHERLLEHWGDPMAMAEDIVGTLMLTLVNDKIIFKDHGHTLIPVESLTETQVTLLLYNHLIRLDRTTEDQQCEATTEENEKEG